MAVRAFFVLYLLGVSILDIRYRQIGRITVTAGFAIALLSFAAETELMWWERAAGVVFGLLLLLISRLTRGRFGSGDALVFCNIGLTVGIYTQLGIFGFSLLMTALCAVILMVFRKVGRKSSLPFVPFVLAAYCLIALTGTTMNAGGG